MPPRRGRNRGSENLGCLAEGLASVWVSLALKTAPFQWTLAHLNPVFPLPAQTHRELARPAHAQRCGHGAVHRPPEAVSVLGAWGEGLLAASRAGGVTGGGHCQLSSVLSPIVSLSVESVPPTWGMSRPAELVPLLFPVSSQPGRQGHWVVSPVARVSGQDLSPGLWTSVLASAPKLTNGPPEVPISQPPPSVDSRC